MTSSQPEFIQWFRSAAPYIHSHRGKTFVVHISGELIEAPVFHHLIHDIALLNSLGIRLVIVFGARPQIDTLLRQAGVETRYVGNLRVTDAPALAMVKQGVGALRVEIEALLSMGLANSPMADARIRVTSGNFITARPSGIIDGTDMQYTGRIRRVHTGLIKNKLDLQEIVLVPPLGFSPTGEVFNINSLELATELAVNLQSDKLIFLLSGNSILSDGDRIVRQLTRQEAETLLGKQKKGDQNAILLEQGLVACKQGVSRIHYIDQSTDGNMMLELFSRDGVGTMLSATPFDDIRHATIEDVGGILELIQPLEEQGVLVRRSREKLEMEIDDYLISVRDGAVIACAALHRYPDESVAELACLVVNDDYRKSGKGRELLTVLEQDAKKQGITRLFVLTTQATHWFLELGFEKASIDDLPLKKKQLYNYQRNSVVLIKQVD
ncbi:MAG TPA: amino-acid N-acetyltransferase [Gammaproteobacteria bacterium]|nr:amino-acid N-acetyltransferase [Gammaproteobacteria bacterium]